MAYDAREADLRDQFTRRMTARNAEIEKDELEKAIKVAQKITTNGNGY